MCGGGRSEKRGKRGSQRVADALATAGFTKTGAVFATLTGNPVPTSTSETKPGTTADGSGQAQSASPAVATTNHVAETVVEIPADSTCVASEQAAANQILPPAGNTPPLADTTTFHTPLASPSVLTQPSQTLVSSVNAGAEKPGQVSEDTAATAAPTANIAATSESPAEQTI